MLNLPVGLLINFGATSYKVGCKRILNGPLNLRGFVPSCEPKLSARLSHPAWGGILEKRKNEILTRRHEGIRKRWRQSLWIVNIIG
ncbi:MAG: hypothetical protein SGI71_09935 [Verrucomicrobiota bacterium]|nr:hypothetical protein [Verrucomicrobiota bacterium]